MTTYREAGWRQTNDAGLQFFQAEYEPPPIANCERCGDDFPCTANDPLDPEYTRCPDCADHDVLCGCLDPDCTNGVI